MNDLIPGEELDFSRLELEENVPQTDETIDAKYGKGDVRIVTEQARYPLPQIVPMIESGNYELNPEFQRRHRWSREHKSRLVESFIMNVPIPPIFLYEDRFSHYEVMDGLQRLTAIHEFYTDRFDLVGLEQWPELNGRRYSSLPDQVRRGVDRRYLSSIILLHETAKDPAEALRLKQLVFERINSGGVSLEPQEARNAILNGPLNELCICLASNTAFRLAWGIPTESDGDDAHDELLQNELYRTMQDVELVLRFFAYRQRLKNHRRAYKAFLDNYLRLGNAFSRPVLAELGDLFTQTIELAYEVLGEEAFWLYRRRKEKWDWLARPTVVVYEPLMYALSGRLKQGKRLRGKAKAIREALPEFYRSNYDEFEGRYTNLSNIRERNRLFGEFLDHFARA